MKLALGIIIGLIIVGLISYSASLNKEMYAQCLEIHSEEVCFHSIK